jgi:hypothetical protein
VLEAAQEASYRASLRMRLDRGGSYQHKGKKLLALPTCPHYVFVVSSEHHEKRNDSFNGPVGINTVRIRALLRLYERQFGDQRSKRQAVRQPEARSCRTSEPFLASLLP